MHHCWTTIFNYFLKILIHFRNGYRSSDIWGAPVPHEKRHYWTIKSPDFLRNHYNIYFLYKTTDISYKSRELVIRLFLRTLCMKEYVQRIVGVNNITTFTVKNVHWEGGDHTSPWNGVHTADKLRMFDLNVQNKPTSSEWNSVTVFFNLRKSNLGRHGRYGYWLKSERDIIDVLRGSNGGYLRYGITPYKFKLNTWNFLG